MNIAALVLEADRLASWLEARKADERTEPFVMVRVVHNHARTLILKGGGSPRSRSRAMLAVERAQQVFRNR